MKNKFLRVLALILVMSSLVSMFAIFANAEESESTEGDTEDAEKNEITLIYNRDYGEGWGVSNGMDMVDQGSTGSTLFTIDREETADFETNYFWRLELNSSDNDYAQLNFGANQNIGTVFEFDVKSDDICNFSNVVSIGTKGNSSDTRTNFCLMRVADNKVYLMESGEPAFELTNSWMRIQIVCDYTYEVYTKEEIEAMTTNAAKDKARMDNENTFLMYVYYGPADGSSQPVLLNNKPLEIVGKSGKGIQMVRFQSTGADKPENYGTSICFDNMKVYDGTNEITEITPDMGYGSLVIEGAAKTEDVGGGTGAATTDITAVLSMKVGVDYCYINKQKKPIAVAEDGTVFGAPVKIDGKVMISLDKVLEYIGLPYYVQPDGKTIAISTGLSATNIVVGKDSANVGGNVVALTAAPGYVTDADGNSYIAIVLSDVEKLFPGYYSDYDDMGYLTVSQTPDLLDRNLNLSAMISVMKEFVFEYYTPESIYNDVKEHTNGFQHPYILANGEQIETMYNEYQALEAKRLAGTLVQNSEEYWMWVHYQRIVDSGESYYKFYAKKNESGNYSTFAGVLTDEEYAAENNGKTRGTSSLDQNYLDAHGYDVGGRSDIANRTTRLEGMAFAYVLTKDVKYLQLCYEVAVILGNWTHWGPGHFLNCADSSNDFAVYYDWTYNGYVELAASGAKRPNGEAYDVAVLAEILARQGVHEGYYSTVNKTSDHLSPVVGTGGGYYSARTNNWAAVCVGGMTVAALAILGDVNDTYVYEATYMLSDNFRTLVELGLDCYAPDGSYNEGPGYWNYGTNNYFRMAAALDSATGKNYGLMDCWGMDTTCYYACHTEDNDAKYFPFHDGSVGSQDTSYFFYVAHHFNDATLYDVRLNQINGNVKWATPIDMIYYPRGIEIDADAVQLDYYSDNIDLFATRASWERGALFASMIGGNNNVTHGQIDAGDFVYHNGGNIWIYDLGTENYNAPGFWPDATRYRYYVMKPEGNNTVAITTDPTGVPYGQLLNAVADAYNWGSNEHGAFVTYDMGKTLGSHVNKWERGMLLTNDRKTTVIQDQIAFDSFQTVYWFAHYSKSYVDSVEISEDGKTAYMREDLGGGKYQTLRLAIVSNQNVKFEIMDTYTFVHTTEKGFSSSHATYSPEDVAQLGTEKEKSRANYMKLAISSGEALVFNVAVVIELVDDATVGKKNEIEVGYTYDNMSTWVPSADTRGLEVDTEDTIVRRGIPDVNKHIVQSIAKIEAMEKQGSLYTAKVKDYYRALTDGYYAVKTLGRDLPAEYLGQADVLKEYREAFAAYRKAITGLQKDQLEFAYKLMGLK